MSLQEEAQERRKRLQLLKRKKEEGQSGELAVDPKLKKSEELPRPVFRSYRPHDENLKESALPPTKAPEVISQVEEQLKSAKPEPLIEEVDLANLAPRKPDWDLKRDVAKKLEKLERRTQRAIAELIRDRLKNDEADLATAVSGAQYPDASRFNTDDIS